MVGVYAQTLRQQIAVGEITRDQAFEVMLSHGVHPRIAARLLAETFVEDLDPRQQR